MVGIEYLLYVTALVLVLSFPCMMNHLTRTSTVIADNTRLSASAQLDVLAVEAAQATFVLFTTFGGEYSPERLQEVTATLSNNANLASVATLYILSDPATMVAMRALTHNPKVKFVSHPRQPTYQHLFAALNQRTASTQLGTQPPSTDVLPLP